MFDSIRLRLTLGYVGILALILLLFGGVLVLGFRDATVRQHDDLLIKEARAWAATAAREGRVTMTTESGEYALVQLTPGGSVQFRDATARSLGLPAEDVARRTVAEGERVMVTTGGTEGAARVASVPVFDGSGQVTGVVQFGRSLRTELEAVDRLLLVLIPIGVGSLLLAGVGGLLMSRRAMRPAREAFERQRAFIADASHELKTPLSLARIAGEVLAREPEAPDAAEIRARQLSEIDRTSAILSDLLTLARLDAGKLGVGRETFDLAQVIFETADRFRTRAADGSVTLEVSVPGKIPARGDAGRTGQILAAVLDNATRLTPEGGCVTATGNLREGRAEAVISDTGPGIPPDHLPRVFDRFYRVESARARGKSGGGHRARARHRP
ncbi:MAG: hypothetical protein H0U91_12225 [Rubrobacter sp.]|jgi:signal transduction histidine kinase|nr:hypothetical protein [Rubrobacter sp.]MBA3950848.1 hypothetical protein [Rubrobacter sp.]MDQ3360818.1 ATP-binding protein [Actinomycetota bacterium]